MRDEQAVWREHLEAVQGNDPHAFLRLVEQDGVLLGKVSSRLDPDEQKVLRSIRSYCERWNAEGGPHPSTLPPRPVGGDFFELKRWRDDRSGHSELLDWNHATIKHLRGCWAAVLDRLATDSVDAALKGREESGSTALTMPTTGTTKPPSSVSRSLAPSWSEAAAFAHAKSQEDLYKHLVDLSLHRESLEQLKTVAAYVVREGRGHDLPALHQIVGAVNELLLLEGREKVLSRLPPSPPSPPIRASLLGSASSIHPRWLYRKTHDYMLADRDDEFRDRKTRAVRQLIEMLPKAESEVRTVATALDLGVPVDQVSALPTHQEHAAVRKEAAAVEVEPPQENPAARRDDPSRAGPRILDLADLIPDPASSRTPSPSAVITPPSLPPTLAAFNVDPMSTMFRGPTVMGALHERLQREADQARRIQSEIERMNLIQARADEQLDCMREIRDQLRAAAAREHGEEEAPVVRAATPPAEAPSRAATGSVTNERRRRTSAPWLGNGGPANTLDAVRRAVLDSKGKGATLAAGDRTTHGSVMEKLEGQDSKKARDYLAPSGRLSKGGWIIREGEDVVLTETGVRDAEERALNSQRRESALE